MARVSCIDLVRSLKRAIALPVGEACNVGTAGAIVPARQPAKRIPLPLDPEQFTASDTAISTPKPLPITYPTTTPVRSGSGADRGTNLAKELQSSSKAAQKLQFALSPNVLHLSAFKERAMIPLPHPIPYQGSKRSQASFIASRIPNEIGVFYEPFAGSAAMTLCVARKGISKRFVIADACKPLVDLWEAIVDDPKDTATRYHSLWNGQRARDANYYYSIRDRYNQAGDPVDLLYLICRCVKNAVRFNRNGHFTQAVDKRRLGMRPGKMESAIFGASYLLKGKVEFRRGDWQASITDARDADFIYMDPPYFGLNLSRDKRYHQQLCDQTLVEGLEKLIERRIRFALSYDGSTGGKEYGPPLPEKLGLTRILLHVGRSSQATLNGRSEDTVESLYLSPLIAMTSISDFPLVDRPTQPSLLP